MMYHSLKKIALNSINWFQAFLLKKKLFSWIPIFFGIGIAIYFMLSFEPSLKAIYGLITCAICLFITTIYCYYRKKFLSRIFFLGGTLVICGFLNIFFHTHYFAVCMLKESNKATKITGTIKSIEKFPNLIRILLKQDDVNRTLRLSLRGKLQSHNAMIIGNKISANVTLNPIPYSPFPGSFNFRRHLFYQGIGATGYINSEIQIIQNNNFKWYLKIINFGKQLRNKITQYLRKTIRGENGAIATALITGDKFGISRTTKQAFANAGIAHILAISGLHLSIVIGLIFVFLRFCLCLIPGFANRYDSKKVAAYCAFVFATVYLLISGVNTPVLRAYFMSIIVLISICTERISLTIRGVALVAMMILIVSPQLLITPSFQLSFAAVTGLVAFYEKYNKKFQLIHSKWTFNDHIVLKKMVVYFIGIILSSLIATVTTAPFTIFTFNQIPLTAMITNLIAIPLVSFLVLPLLIIHLILGTIFPCGEFIPITANNYHYIFAHSLCVIDFTKSVFCANFFQA